MNTEINIFITSPTQIKVSVINKGEHFKPKKEQLTVMGSFYGGLEDLFRQPVELIGDLYYIDVINELEHNILSLLISDILVARYDINTLECDFFHSEYLDQKNIILKVDSLKNRIRKMK